MAAVSSVTPHFLSVMWYSAVDVAWLLFFFFFFFLMLCFTAAVPTDCNTSFLVCNVM